MFHLHTDISDYVSYIMQNIFDFSIVILCDVFLIRNKVFVSYLVSYSPKLLHLHQFSAFLLKRKVSKCTMEKGTQLSFMLLILLSF